MIVIIRGLPGAGHTRLARTLSKIFKDCKTFSADDFMVDENGNYSYDQKRLSECHNKCQSAAFEHKGTSIVANTFVRGWEIEKYLCKDRDLIVFDIFDGGMSDSELSAATPNQVPIEKIAQMRCNYQFFYNDKTLRVSPAFMEILKPEFMENPE